MPNATRRNSSTRESGRGTQVYDAPGWEDEGALIPGRNKEFIRKATEKGSGRKGVIKFLSRDARNPGRFHDEAVNMKRLNGTSGIMPVWDIDKAVPDRPRWYAMPQAQLLARALGNDATLRDVATAIAYLADILTRLAKDGTYHRDIKPDNLFSWNGSPVLADFGIAAWGTTGRTLAGATRVVEKLGPANFIAPEMRWGRPADRGKHADVYSLAKTLFVLALPHRGRYPPDGTHRVDSEEFSMGETGGGYSLAELGHVLEAATEFDPRRRLLMSDFRDELYAWLGRYPDMQFHRLGDQAKYQHVARFWERSSRDRRDREETGRMMAAHIADIAEALTGDEDAWAEEDGEDGGEVLGDYAWEPNTEDDGFMPENGTIWMATEAVGGRRIVLWAVLDGYVSFVAESQTGGPAWKLEKQWDRTAWSRPRMPRTADQLKRLTYEVIAWIPTVATGPGS
jgi:serine/threonine protein kinase